MKEKEKRAPFSQALVYMCEEHQCIYGVRFKGCFCLKPTIEVSIEINLGL
jgi:hypothetical protein